MGPDKTKPARGGLPRLSMSAGALRSLLNAGRGGTLGPFLGLVAHLGALGQGLEALTQDGAVMNEDVLRAVIGRDEPVALVVAKPLYGSSMHALPPHRVLQTLTVRNATTCGR